MGYTGLVSLMLASDAEAGAFMTMGFAHRNLPAITLAALGTTSLAHLARSLSYRVVVVTPPEFRYRRSFCVFRSRSCHCAGSGLVTKDQYIGVVLKG